VKLLSHNEDEAVEDPKHRQQEESAEEIASKSVTVKWPTPFDDVIDHSLG